MNASVFQEAIKRQKISMTLWMIVAIDQIIFGVATGIIWFVLYFAVAALGIWNLHTVKITHDNINFFQKNPDNLVPYCQKRLKNYGKAMIWNIIVGLIGLTFGWLLLIFILPAIICGIVGGIWDYNFDKYVLAHANELTN